MTACFLFGDEISDFSTFQNSLNKIFYYIFGIGTASEYSIYYQMLFQFFFITASMLFFFTLTKMLVSMVIIRYRYLRSLKQKRNEAMARIISNKSQKLKEKLLNLILFRRQDLSSNKDGEEVDERSIISRRWMIFKLNFNDLFKIGELKSLDEKEAEIKEIEQQIKQEKLTLNLNKLKKYSEENIEEHKRTLIQAIIYSIFLIIFVTIITSQINLEL